MRYAGTFENIYDSKEVQIKFRKNKKNLLVVLKKHTFSKFLQINFAVVHKCIPSNCFNFMSNISIDRHHFSRIYMKSPK